VITLLLIVMFETTSPVSIEPYTVVSMAPAEKTDLGEELKVRRKKEQGQRECEEGKRPCTTKGR
jgi:hypothetical protein